MAARLTKPSPKLTVVKRKREHWGIRLNNFRVKYDLSERDLAAVLDYTLQKSSIHKLCSGIVNPRMESVIKPTIAGKLRTFLKEKRGKNDIEIESEMLEIFYEPICKKETEPVLTERKTLSRSAQLFFGLKGDPFPNEPPRSRSETFTTPELDKIARKLDDAIRYQGFLAIIGGVGSGKSFMRRRVDESCDRSNGKMRLLYPDFANMDKVHSASICSFILREFGAKVPQDRLDRYRRLKELLKRLSDDGVRIALGFDECHRLDPRLLTALKNFWEMGTGGYDRWLGLILFGWPSFQATLSNSDFWEIGQRLKVIEMPTLRKDGWDYVAHRLKLMGGNAEKLIDHDAVAQLVKIGNTPLALGNLVNRTLAKAHELNEKKVTRGLVASMLHPESNEPRVRAVSGGVRS